MTAQAAPDTGPARGLVMVELFTSQGCSSCPPADAVLGDLARRPDVLALSLPVDYWDNLGWTDTYAKAAFTARQRAYSAQWQSNRVYTPQAVINGTLDVVGSRRQAMVDSVNAQAALVQPLTLGLQQGATGLTLSIRSALKDAATIPAGADIWVARFQARGHVTIKRGENGGRDLDYWNVVTDLHRLDAYHGGDVTLTLSEPAPQRGTGLAVFVQAGAGPILGAAKLSAAN
jgi:hypothetical protein